MTVRWSYKLNEEYAQLVQEHCSLRTYILPRVDGLPCHFTVNLQHIIQGATQVFHIDWRKPNNLEPSYIVDVVHQLAEQLVTVFHNEGLHQDERGMDD